LVETALHEPCHTRWGAKPFQPPRLQDFCEAAVRIKGVAVRTPLMPLHSYNESNGVYLKPEVLQPVTSFKLRGVYNWASCLPPEKRSEGLYTISAGNTAQAIGYVANLFGVPSKTFLPDTVPQNKVEAVKSYGLDVEMIPLKDYFTWEPEQDCKGCFLHPFAEPMMIAGNGTIGLEIMEDLPDVDTVYVPVGGGGLVNGIGRAVKAIKPDVRIVGVQPENYPALSTSLNEGGPVKVDMKPTISDGVAAPMIDVMFHHLKEILDEQVMVSEFQIKQAVKRLALRNKLVVEGAGALSVAAAMMESKERRGKTVCILSGGSIDHDKLSLILNNPNFL